MKKLINQLKRGVALLFAVVLLYGVAPLTPVMAHAQLGLPQTGTETRNMALIGGALILGAILMSVLGKKKSE